jgi:K+-transporting ATPase c subunit
MTSIINASVSSNGIVSTADASGILNIQSNGKNTNAQAWVHFNPSSGSAVINASYNVSSITYSAVGEYIINFTNAFANTYYAVSGSAKQNGGGNPSQLRVVSISSNAATQAASQTTTSVSVAVTYANGSGQDPSICTVMCIG